MPETAERAKRRTAEMFAELERSDGFQELLRRVERKQEILGKEMLARLNSPSLQISAHDIGYYAGLRAGFANIKMELQAARNTLEKLDQQAEQTEPDDDGGKTW